MTYKGKNAKKYIFHQHPSPSDNETYDEPKFLNNYL